MVDPISTAPLAGPSPTDLGTQPPAGGAFAATLQATLAAQPGPPTGGTLVTLGQMVDRQQLAAARLPLAPGLPSTSGLSEAGAFAAAAPSTGTLGVGPAAASRSGPDGLQVPVAGRVTSRFGPRIHPITGRQQNHSGIDIAAPTGTPIAAAAAGTVTFAGVRGGYGNLVIIDHGDGRETRYAHADRMLVQVGQRVGAGEQVATVGATGTATGPHLHLEVRVDGTAVDPAPLLGL